MTCQPAVEVGIFLPMAFDTLTHAPVLVRQSMQGFNLSMTFPAANLTIDVALMIEQYMFCHIINFYPGCWRLRIKVAVLYLDPRMFGDDVVMAVQTLFHRRQSWKIGVCNIRVAVLTLYLLDAAVHIVAERDRLLRADVGQWRIIEKIDEYTRKDQDEKY